MYRQNLTAKIKERNKCPFFWYVKRLTKSRFELVKWPLKTGISCSLWFFASFPSVKGIGEDSGSSESASGINLLSFTYEIYINLPILERTLALDCKTVVFLRIQVSASSQTKGLERGWKRRVRACEARALRARKTRTPRLTDFFTDFEKKTDCFAVYFGSEMAFQSIYLWCLAIWLCACAWQKRRETRKALLWQNCLRLLRSYEQVIWTSKLRLELN